MRGPLASAVGADLFIDGEPYLIDRLDDIAWLRTAQFMRGIDLQEHVDLDKRADAMRKARDAARREARKRFFQKRVDKKGRAYTESAYSA